MKRLNNQQGISLVEVLATIVILAIIGTLLFNIITKGKEQYNQQIDKNQELSAISYKLKVLTKEIREAKEVKYIDLYSIEIIFDATKPSIIYIFDSTTGILSKDGEPFLTNVEFEATPNSSMTKATEISIKVSHKSSSKPISTKIFVRSES